VLLRQSSLRRRKSNVKSFEAGVYVNNIKEFSPYLKENTTLYHFKDRYFNSVEGKNCYLQKE
jgi:hypothetical protein